MSLRKEIEKEEKSNYQQMAWGGLIFGIILLLLGIYLEWNNQLQPFFTQANSRYSSATNEVLVKPKSSAIACFVLSFFLLLLSYAGFRNMKMQKNKFHFKK